MNEINKFNFHTDSSSNETLPKVKKENIIKNEEIASHLDGNQIESTVPQLPVNFVNVPIIGSEYNTHSYLSYDASSNSSTEASSEIFAVKKIIVPIEMTAEGRAQALRDFGIEDGQIPVPHPMKKDTSLDNIHPPGNISAIGSIQPCTRETAVKFKYHALLAAYYPITCDDKSELKTAAFKPEQLSIQAHEANNPRIKLMAELANGLRKMGFKHSSNGIFYNERTGTCFYLVVGDLLGDKDKRVMACFGGLRSEILIDDKISVLQEAKMCKSNMQAAAKDFLGGVPKASLEAMKIGSLLKECCKATVYKPEVIGHSHGGGLAVCAACAADIPATIFNARPIGSGMRQHIETYRKKHSLEGFPPITNFVTKDDWVAHESGMLHGVASLLHKHPAFLMGNAYELPRPQGVNAHNGFLEALMDRIGSAGDDEISK